MVMSTWATLHVWSSPPSLTAATGKATTQAVHFLSLSEVYLLVTLAAKPLLCLLTLQAPSWRQLHTVYPYTTNQLPALLFHQQELFLHSCPVLAKFLFLSFFLLVSS